MSVPVAFTVRCYVAEFSRVEQPDAVVMALSADADFAVETGLDLPVAALVALLERLAEQGPSDLGLRCGSARRLAELGVVGHAIASCHTLGEALQIAIARGVASDPLREVRYQTRGHEWIIELRVAPTLTMAVRRLVCEEWIASFFAHLTEVTEIARPQVRIELDYAAGQDIDYARWLPAIPHCGKRRCRLVFPTELLNQRLVSYDHEMLQLVLRHFAERPVTQSSTVDRVRRHLVLSEGRAASLSSAATVLGLSTRTLARRLDDEGTTFGTLLNEHRQGYALALARDTRLSTKQIAAALGYRSEQSLRRAFMQWTGKPLGRWRRDLKR